MPHKPSLAGPAPCYLSTTVGGLAEWGSKYGCRNLHKKVPQTAKEQTLKMTKLGKTAPNLANEVGFLRFWPKPISLRGNSEGQISAQ